MTTLTLPALVDGTAPALSLGRRVRRPLARAVRASGSLLLIAGALLFAGLAVGPHLLGYQTVTMLTGSMSPTIRPGDVVVDTPEPVGAVRPGQIISYHVPLEDHRVVSHRIVSVAQTPGGAVTVRTKGDANASEDPWTAQLQGQQDWQVRTVVPRLGALIGLLRGPYLMRLVLIALLMLATDGLISIWRRPPPPAPTPAPTPAQ